jgi:hypothetical protein
MTEAKGKGQGGRAEELSVDRASSPLSLRLSLISSSGPFLTRCTFPHAEPFP